MVEMREKGLNLISALQKPPHIVQAAVGSNFPRRIFPNFITADAGAVRDSSSPILPSASFFHPLQRMLLLSKVLCLFKTTEHAQSSLRILISLPTLSCFSFTNEYFSLHCEIAEATTLPVGGPISLPSRLGAIKFHMRRNGDVRSQFPKFPPTRVDQELDPRTGQFK